MLLCCVGGCWLLCVGDVGVGCVMVGGVVWYVLPVVGCVVLFGV